MSGAPGDGGEVGEVGGVEVRVGGGGVEVERRTEDAVERVVVWGVFFGG